MNEPNRKLHRRYLFYRFYASIVWLSVAICVILWWMACAANREPSIAWIVTFAILFPLFGIAVFMLQSLSVFPLEYTCFGPLERTTLPREQPLFKQTGSWGRVGSFRATVPFFNWYVYASGLGVSILGIGKFFIPYRYFEALNEGGNSIFFGSHYQLIHNSPEVQSPIYLPDKELFEALRTAFETGHLR